MVSRKRVQPTGNCDFACPISQNARNSIKIGVLQVYGIIKLFEHTVFQILIISRFFWSISLWGRGRLAGKIVDFWSSSPKTLCLLVAKAPETPENERAEQAFDETFDRFKKY